MPRAIIVTDLQYGDAGKGTTVHYACVATRAHTVVRMGGPQAVHAVQTGDGKRFLFSQFGSGTLNGARTHLSSEMMVEPHELYREAQRLADIGISNPMGLLSIDGGALVNTPFHAAVSQLREIARGEGRHGSTGFGIGETIRHAERFPDEAIRARDLRAAPRILREKLAAVRERECREVADLIEVFGDQSDVAREASTALCGGRALDDSVTVFGHIGYQSRVVEADYLGKILRWPGTVVFEPSQGVLLDRWRGFHPYTTTCDPTQGPALRLLRRHGYGGDVDRIGILRAYAVRHGPGPFVTEDAELTDRLPDRDNRENTWQGRFRVGYPDLVALRYAVEASGGPAAFDALMVTCLDRLKEMPRLEVCDAYESDAESEELEPYFTRKGGILTDIRVRPCTFDDAHLARQERLGRLLLACRPRYTPISREEYVTRIEESSGIPVRFVSTGPTDRDKSISSAHRSRHSRRAG